MDDDDDGCCGGGIGPIPYPNCVDCPRREKPMEEPAYAVIDASGRIDPMSVRQHPSTCEIYAYIHDLALKGNFSIVPVRIICELDFI